MSVVWVMVDYSNFHRTLNLLRVQYEHYQQLDPSHSDLVREAVVESIVKRFEMCSVCLWKALRRYLIEKIGLADVPKNPKGTFILANRNGLLIAPIEQWFLYLDTRVDVAYNYSSAKGRACVSLVESFIADASNLSQRMSGESIAMTQVVGMWCSRR